MRDALKIVTRKTALTLHPSERVVPFKVARDVILENPGAIAVGTCACRAVQQNPCLPPPQEVCLILGDPFASFIADHNPKFRRGSQEEAVRIIEEAHKRGEVQCAYFKKETGNRLDRNLQLLRLLLHGHEGMEPVWWGDPHSGPFGLRFSGER